MDAGGSLRRGPVRGGFSSVGVEGMDLLGAGSDPSPGWCWVRGGGGGVGDPRSIVNRGGTGCSALDPDGFGRGCGIASGSSSSGSFKMSSSRLLSAALSDGDGIDSDSGRGCSGLLS